ncbi:helix-turn-helix transcriptional regulator [Reticulibacter mediterranei]|uniref:Helix-turn-helix transcriptional regulator n=1 Tax=Reticulibacter mediterranei TaxID=2778369 RepID=A0A8J3N9F3_9CHLR|nr:helix-turn-helix transcriptional regulator [Reticulibacter mediterranei]
MLKCYAGRSAQLSLERLEDIAAKLSSEGAVLPPQSQHSQQHTPRAERTASTFASPSLEPLLLPKLQLPRHQPSLLQRDHLLTLLDQGLEYKVTLISVAAGYGKTTLVSHWLTTRSQRSDFPHAACITFDEGDNDPIRFWRYMIAACQQWQPELGKGALDLLHEHLLPSFKPLDAMLIALLNDVSHLEHPGMLILDNLHVITSPQIAATLSFFLEHLPASLHLVLLVRGDPPFSLARLRARNEVLDISPLSMCFSLEETSAFLAQELSFTLSPRAVHQVYERLEGWPVGLRFLVEMLRWSAHEQEIEHILTAFFGSTEHSISRQALNIHDYFLHEIFHTLSEEMQTFLLHTCMLPRLTASLCDALTKRDDSVHLLTMLRKGDCFLMSLDWEGTWARYHPLFAEAMQQEARRSLGEERIRALAIRASRWYEADGLLPEAIETAFTAAAYHRAARLIARSLEQHQQINEPGTTEWYRLKRWLERLPEADLEHHPDLCLYAARNLLFHSLEAPSCKERIHHLLLVAEHHWRETNTTAKLAEVFAFRALLARQEGRILQSVSWATQALAWLPQKAVTWRILALSAVGIGELHNGILVTAREHFLAVLPLNEQQGSPTGARATRSRLSRVSFEMGELRQAAEQLRQIQAEARSVSDHDDIARTQGELAQIFYQWNDLAAAEQAAHEALLLGEQMNIEEVQARASALLAHIEHRHGQTAQAMHRLTAWLAQRQTTASLHTSREVQARLVRIQLADDDLASVRRWAVSHQNNEERVPRYQRQCEQLLRARFFLARAETITAIELLEQLSTAALRTGHLHFRLEVQVVLALAYAKLRAYEKAREQLVEVLETTRGEGYLRLFLDEGKELALLLRALLPSLHEKALLVYVRQILGAFAQESRSSDEQKVVDTMLLPEPLSPQEQKVLRLLVAGNSNAEMASALVVSINTIRTHVQSIYRKLGVHNRLAASAVANQLKHV